MIWSFLSFFDCRGKKSRKTCIHVKRIRHSWQLQTAFWEYIPVLFMLVPKPDMLILISIPDTGWVCHCKSNVTLKARDRKHTIILLNAFSAWKESSVPCLDTVFTHQSQPTCGEIFTKYSVHTVLIYNTTVLFLFSSLRSRNEDFTYS